MRPCLLRKRRGASSWSWKGWSTERGPGRRSSLPKPDRPAEVASPGTPTEVPDDHATRPHQHEGKRPQAFRDSLGRTVARVGLSEAERHAAQKELALVRTHIARELLSGPAPLPRP